MTMNMTEQTERKRKFLHMTKSHIRTSFNTVLDVLIGVGAVSADLTSPKGERPIDQEQMDYIAACVFTNLPKVDTLEYEGVKEVIEKSFVDVSRDSHTSEWTWRELSDNKLFKILDNK